MAKQTTALFVFIQQNSEIPILRTADTDELIKIKNTDWIALGEQVLINNKIYNIVNIVIEPFTTQSQFIPEHEYDLGQAAFYYIHLRIYLSVQKLQ